MKNIRECEKNLRTFSRFSIEDSQFKNVNISDEILTKLTLIIKDIFDKNGESYTNLFNNILRSINENFVEVIEFLEKSIY